MIREILVVIFVAVASNGSDYFKSFEKSINSYSLSYPTGILSLVTDYKLLKRLFVILNYQRLTVLHRWVKQYKLIAYTRSGGMNNIVDTKYFMNWVKYNRYIHRCAWRVASKLSQSGENSVDSPRCNHSVVYGAYISSVLLEKPR